MCKTFKKQPELLCEKCDWRGNYDEVVTHKKEGSTIYGCPDCDTENYIQEVYIECVKCDTRITGRDYNNNNGCCSKCCDGKSNHQDVELRLIEDYSWNGVKDGVLYWGVEYADTGEVEFLGEVTAPESQEYLDSINEIFGTSFKMNEFAGR